MRSILSVMLLAGCLYAAKGRAQTAKKFSLLAEAGFLAGSYGPGAEGRLSFLWNKGRWQAGLGAGLDSYRFQSVPVVVTGRHFLGSGSRRLFAVASAGVNADALTSAQRQNNTPVWWRWNNVPAAPPEYGIGSFGEVGLGYGWFFKKRHALLLSVLYVHKRTSETFNRDTWLGFGQVQTNPETNIYLMNRLAFRVGWQF